MSAPNMEQNKIFGAILVAGLVAMLAGFFSGKIMPNHPLEEDAYPVEVPETAVVGAPVVEAVAEPIDELMAVVDAAQGEKLMKACMACHSLDKGGPHKIGPNLWGVYGAVKGSKDYPYSDVLKNDGRSWDTATLNAFLWKPKKTYPGTKMNYPGMRKPEDRAAAVKYLQSLK